MVFSSVTFLFYFLPLFLLAYWLLPWRNGVLLIASLLFYAWGEPQNLPLLLTSIVVNYAFGRWIGRAQESGADGKWIFSTAIVFNLAALSYYKYANFAVASFLDLLAMIGVASTPSAEIKHVALPLGISFFTFHAISYLVDVYRKKVKAEKNFTALFTYIIMFPQLVAGPIVRFSAVARQLHQRRFSWMRIDIGLRFFVIGLAQKMLIANTLATSADQIFSLPAAALQTSVAWLGAASYTLQIYFDFAGYSNMAIGLGLACGFSFPRNFQFPYAAQSITQFWRGWHMSLSRWFRDYVYIPLGGNRLSSTRTSLHLFIVFFLCGLWHGANWTFVCWGLYHGLFLALERVGLSRVVETLWRPLRHTYTLLIVVFGWVLFRSDSIAQAGSFGKTMLGIYPALHSGFVADSAMSFLNQSTMLALIFGALFSVRSLLPLSATLKINLTGVTSSFLSLLLFALCCLTLASGAYNPFIYFRF